MPTRKKLTEIQDAWENPDTNLEEESSLDLSETSSDNNKSDENSLTASLLVSKKKPVKVRFTLDLEKPLDSRLTKAASKLNRTKADLTRIALEKLLTQLEEEWGS